MKSSALLLALLACVMGRLVTVGRGSRNKFLKMIKPTFVKQQASLFNLEAAEQRLQPQLDFHPTGKIPQPVGAGNIQPMIVGGKRVMRWTYPWFALLNIDGSVLCGGSLITKDYVLSAAHCVQGFTTFKVNFGGIDRFTRESGELFVDVKSAIYHERYNPVMVWNDISLLNLATPIELNSMVNVIRLPKLSDATKSFTNYNMSVCGYGQTDDDSESSRYLLATDLLVTSNLNCESFYGIGTISSSNICTAAHPNNSICNGDSGGPLYHKESDGNYTLRGIVSFGAATSCHKSLSGYARVSSFLGWISNKTNTLIRKD